MKIETEAQKEKEKRTDKVKGSTAWGEPKIAAEVAVSKPVRTDAMVSKVGEEEEEEEETVDMEVFNDCVYT